MPLAQAAPRIGCERSPSLARSHRPPTRLGARLQTRGPASINDRDRSFRAQAKVVRDGPPRGSGSNADITMIQAHTLPLPSRRITRVRRIDVPRKPSSGELGNLPIYRSQERRFGSDILWKTGRNRSTRSMGHRTRLVEPPPARFQSRRLLSSARPIHSGRARADRTGELALSLRLVSHLETT